MKIKALLFDFDETLLVNEESTREAVRRAWKTIQSDYLGILPENVVDTYMQVRDEFWTRPDDTIMSILKQKKEEIRRVLWKMTLCELNINPHDLVDNLVQTFGKARYDTWDLYQDSMELLNQLKKNYQLVMITNGVPEIQRSKIMKTGVASYFNPIIISGEIGVSKPDPQYFHITLQKIRRKPDECLVIGDSVRNDVGGAYNSGILSVWVNRDNSLPRPAIQPDYEIHQLEELLPILKELG